MAIRVGTGRDEGWDLADDAETGDGLATDTGTRGMVEGAKLETEVNGEGRAISDVTGATVSTCAEHNTSGGGAYNRRH